MAQMLVREALRSAIYEEMERDERVFIMGEEVGEYQGAYKVTQGLLDAFGKSRVVDTPITEHGIAGLAVGSAFYGLIPILEFMSFNFSMQAIDHVVNSAAKTSYMSGGKLKCPIVFRGPNGHASRVGAQHSQCFASWYAHVPGLKVIAPYFASDCKGLLKSAIRDPNPVIFLENEIAYLHMHEVPNDFGSDYLVEIGVASIVRSGLDISIITFSIDVHTVMEAAKLLQEHGISVEIIDLRTLSPLDMDTILSSVKKTNRAMIVESGWRSFGIGSEIAARISEEAFDYLDAPVLRVGSKDIPLPYAENLERAALPSIDNVVSAVLGMFGKN